MTRVSISAEGFVAIYVANASSFRRFMIFEPGEELLEKRIVNAAALGVILHSASEWIFSQMNLLDDAIVRGPGFNFQIVSQPFNCLVMCALHFWKAVRSAASMAQPLNFAIALFRQRMTFNVELHCAAKRDG